MLAADHPAVFGQGRGNVLHDLARRGARLVIGDIQALAADEADPQHDLCHGQAA
jgi:hypothetical protein